MRLRGIKLGLTLLTGVAAAQTSKCNLDNCKPAAGMSAEQNGDSLILTWPGESNVQLQIKQVQPPGFAGGCIIA